ncbi:MAG: hypothetical protein JOZ77_10675 [Candidatus Eremiobacteraeota bacterium]|nr:hypothetical protein [Candidatus Eremiobacteraeota bacterium]
MQFLKLSLLVATMFAVAACAGKSSSNTSDQTNTVSSPASADAAATTAAATTTAAPAGSIPNYPGATTAYSATSQGQSGTVMTTNDSFATVYAWYQQHMPAGSEKAHMTAPVESAIFSVGPDNDQTSVSITSATGKTTITIAHAKR